MGIKGMSTATDSISTLYYSPYILAPLFEIFYEGQAKRPKDILLSYLILPLIVPPSTRAFFKNATSASTLHTFCRSKAHLFGLEKRISDLKDLTHRCLFLTKEIGSIDFSSDMSILFKEHKLDHSATSDEMIKATRKLGIILSRYDIPTSYRILGIKAL